MKTFFAAATAASLASMLFACARQDPPPDPPRPVHTVALSYGAERETNRYFGTVASRHEVDQAFRVGGKVVERRVDVGQSVRAGDIVAVLDAVDYQLAEQAAGQRLNAAQARQRQAESDAQRLQALRGDGSVSDSDEEQARSALLTARSAAEAEARQLELARNQVQYTVLRASMDGVVTSLKVEAGQVVASGQPVVAIANEGEPEIIVDVPEAQLDAFKTAHYRAWLASAPDAAFDVTLREMSAQAAAQTRTYRARLKPVLPRRLPLGATATLVAEHVAADRGVALIPAAALSLLKGQSAVWAVRREGNTAIATVELVPVAVQGYHADEVAVAGPPAGTLVVTAGVQKMSPGLRVALPGAAQPLVATLKAAP